MDQGWDPNDSNALEKALEELRQIENIENQLAEGYAEYVKAYKNLEEDRKEWDDFWAKQEKANQDFIIETLAPQRLTRLNMIYRSLYNIFASWNGKIQRKTEDGVETNVKPEELFAEDTVYMCMKMAAADKEVSESEAGFINDITGINKTPLQYYEFYKNRKDSLHSDPVDSLAIAMLMDMHEGEKGKQVNEENVRYFFMEIMKTVSAIDGERSDGKAQLQVTMMDELNELCRRIRVMEGYRRFMIFF